MEESITKVEGEENLNGEEKMRLDKAINFNEPKVKRMVHPEKIELKIKTYHTEGQSKQYSLNLAVYINNRKFDVDHAEWELSSALNKTFDKITQELEHHFHISDQ